tara:strand:+ start:697 stop:969 length:273 start_codon:yes stop_codon:yes gene_type:complete
MTEIEATPDHLVTWVINETEEETVGTVSVTFTCGTTEITHDRSVNTIGCEDDAAIQQRLSEVARGVHNKICVGAITAPTEVTEETPTEEI